MTLEQLLAGVKGSRISGDPRVGISGLSVDSRRTRRGDLFVALSGRNSDGAAFIPAALGLGAAAVAAEATLAELPVPTVFLPEARHRVGILSSRIYGNPTKSMRVVGVTGTNGKTTTTYLIEMMLSKLGRSVGVLGTVNHRFMGRVEESARTTPEAPEIQQKMGEMKSAGVTDVVMECSSHGLDLGRLDGIHFDVAILTNITPDHLDFHGTMEAYAAAKKRFFEELLPLSEKPTPWAVLNMDDVYGERWARALDGQVMTYSVRKPEASIYARNVQLSADGIRADVVAAGEIFALQSHLVGEHNLANLLATLATAMALGIPAKEAEQVLRGFSGVPGRLERVPSRTGRHVFVDYAHTEDALANVLRSLAPLRTGKLFLVFGCGGDRDRLKRPAMGRVAALFADDVIVTSDNPRSETPQVIVDEILEGISAEGLRKTEGIVDRKQAISRAIQKMNPGDVVLIAGKGHETYQEIAGQKFPFHDVEVAAAALAKVER